MSAAVWNKFVPEWSKLFPAAIPAVLLGRKLRRTVPQAPRVIISCTTPR